MPLKLSKAKAVKLEELQAREPNNKALEYAVNLLEWANDGSNTSDPPTPPGGPPNS